MDLKNKIADMVPASRNPRKALKPGDKEYEKIKCSIQKFGYCYLDSTAESMKRGETGNLSLTLLPLEKNLLCSFHSKYNDGFPDEIL